MSYEGYTEYLCEQGHYFCRDAYDSDPVDCPVCQSRVAHFSMVDVTNGVDEDEPYSIPAEKELNWGEYTKIPCEDPFGNKYYQVASTWSPVGNRWKKWRNDY